MLAHEFIRNQRDIDLAAVLRCGEIQKLHSKLMRQRLGHIFLGANLRFNESLTDSLATAFGKFQGFGDLVRIGHVPLHQNLTKFQSNLSSHVNLLQSNDLQL